MNKLMWQPSEIMINQAQISQFIQYINSEMQLSLTNYDDLYEWSIRDIPAFWSCVWDFCEIINSHRFDQIVDDYTKMPGARWFSGARLNFAENLLRFRDNRPAIISQGEGEKPQIISYSTLFENVAKVAQFLRQMGIRKGDRVAGFIPNIPEAVIAMLATSAIGAVWSSSSPDFGIKGVLDRFRQIKPKILIAADGYRYNGKTFDSLEKLSGILKALPTVQKVIVVSYTGNQTGLEALPNVISYKDILNEYSTTDLRFEQLPFDHPLYIMYSSGTTGLPKSIVHGAGGTLIQHLKELRLHTDLTRDDTIFYFTTCGWMMWNWLVSSLAIGATIVLYDGSPFYPDPGALWKMTQDFGITVFGTSAKFIAASEAAGVKPGKSYDLSKLRTILSTGSPLIEESFDYVYRDVKTDVQLASISGGTDIISCFALGNPVMPVYRGELQCRGLGMKVEAFDESGRAVINKKGELVCSAAFPSMPIYFWNDKTGAKYREAYFNTFPGVWHHGDYIIINDHGGVQIFGRSDATLNPGGVRIGTAEIYRVVEALPEIADSLAVGQEWEGDERVILFIKLVPDAVLTDKLTKQIKLLIRTSCSPRHVPAKILQIADIPYTINGKKVEIAVKKIIHGEDVTNRDALANPEALDLYRSLTELHS